MVVIAVVVIAVVVIAVVVIAVVMGAVIVGGMQLRVHLFNLGQQCATLVGQFGFEGLDLAFDFFEGTGNAIRSHNAKRVCRGDQVVIRQSKLTIGPGVTCRPIELLGIDFNAKGLFRSISCHFVPSAQAKDDDYCEDDGGDDRPNQLNTVVVGEKLRFAVGVLTILVCK